MILLEFGSEKIHLLFELLLHEFHVVDESLELGLIVHGDGGCRVGKFTSGFEFIFFEE